MKKGPRVPNGYLLSLSSRYTVRRGMNDTILC